MHTDTLLIELGTEELPPHAAKALSDSFAEAMSELLTQAEFSFASCIAFVTPRRLAIQIKELRAQQAPQQIVRKGPAVKAAYDADGKPTKAALGFAQSCGVAIDALQTQETDKGAWLLFECQQEGRHIHAVLQDFIEQSLKRLPIPRPMRWGDSEIEFVRPIHWLLVMYGSEVVPCTVKNIAAGGDTYGHRFHAPKAIRLAHADNYVSDLNAAYVLADFNVRKATIEAQLARCADQHNAALDYPQALLAEVTNLVEWPVAMVGQFSQHFLQIPQEALVVTMQDAQRYFPLFDKTTGALLPLFITVANIESHTPDTIKRGNERVIKPRFEDADFFWQRDKETRLIDRGADLEGILFEKQLGSVAAKVERLTQLSEQLCSMLNINHQHAMRAALLCKNDLLTGMVNEFPKLQGVMGRYYALHDNEDSQVAAAIQEHYQPLQAGSQLPATSAGKVLAICDRIDTLIGIFATGKKPTGVKDPYALRRAAIAVIRLSIEGECDFDLLTMLNCSASLLQDRLATESAAAEVFDYIMERLRGYYQDQNIGQDIFAAVRAVQPTRLIDFNARILAVRSFQSLAEATSLAAANKRIANILKKTAHPESLTIDTGLFSAAAEKQLYQQITQLEAEVAPLFAAHKYGDALTALAQLSPSIDRFFEDVMVMDENLAMRNNRIALLSKVSQAFKTAADISLIQN